MSNVSSKTNSQTKTASTPAKRGKKPTFTTAAAKASALRSIVDGTFDMSNYHLKILVKLGYVDLVKDSTKTGKGRKPFVAVVNGKGKGFIALITRNEAKRAEKASADVEPAQELLAA